MFTANLPDTVSDDVPLHVAERLQSLVLRGRHGESEALERLVAAVRAGEGQAMVVCGEPGVGKTALFDHVFGRASGCRVVRVAGVQSEMELPFAGLHQLCSPMLDRMEGLPAPQREALRRAFGLTAGEAPDRFFVGLAALSLLGEVAAELPLICVVDDAQWLDRASTQALAFVARRLSAESVAVVFAVREPGEERELAGLPELVVEGLGDGDARALLDSVITGPLDERVRDRIVAETRGNPLALLELPRRLTHAELAGGFGLPDAMTLSGRLEECFRRRFESLPAPTQLLLLLAAAEPVGDPALLWRGAERLGIGVDAAAPAAAEGLVEFGSRVWFRHPLVRAAVYRAATLQERQRVHRALAEATDPELDPDRRAWHRAQAAPGPDEDVAAELERSADRAQARGGLAAAAAFLEQATALTLEPGRRASRALAAAQAKLEAGAPDMALDLLVTAETGPLDELQQARVDLLRAKIACVVDGGNDAVPLLLDAARQLEPLDVRLARETYLDALSAALYAGHPASGDRVLEVAHAALAAPPAAQPGLASDLLLDGLALRFTDGYAAAMPILKRALTAFRSEDISTEEGIRWLWLACTTAVDLWDDESWEILSTRHVDLARDAGAVTVLPLALGQRISVHVHAGELATAASLIQELTAVNEAIGSERPTVAALWLAACRGREAEASELVDAAMKELTRQGPGVRASIIRGASATLYNGLGHYERALAAAEHGSECPEQLGTSTRALIELVEAAARCGLPDRAADALERLSATTCISATDWALGIEARSRALLTDDETAEELYREAIDRLGRTRVRVELARTHLLYGEWLRRERRRIDAREQLRTAHQLFATMGIGGFAQRAARELRATGETARKRTIEASGRLTAQEAQISRLARDGLSNPEIGSQLFISPRTVEYHLHKVFAKLNIRSRKELDRVLPSEQVAASAV